MANPSDGIDRSHLSDLCLRMEELEDVSISGSDSNEPPANPPEPLQNAVDNTRQRLTALEDEIRNIKRLIRVLNRRLMADFDKRDADRASLKTLLGSMHKALSVYMTENTSP